MIITNDSPTYGLTSAHAFPSAQTGYVHVAVRSGAPDGRGDLTPAAAREYAAAIIATADEVERQTVTQ